MSDTGHPHPYMTDNMEAYLLSLGFRRTAEKAAKLRQARLITKEDLLEAIGFYAEGLMTPVELIEKLKASLGFHSAPTYPSQRNSWLGI